MIQPLSGLDRKKTVLCNNIAVATGKGCDSQAIANSMAPSSPRERHPGR